MKLHPEDPRLTAYVLGELGADETAAIAEVIAADPALQAEIARIQETQQILSKRLILPPGKLTTTQRENIRRTARTTSRPAGILPFETLKNTFQTWLIPIAAAAVLTIATYILFQMPGEPPAATTSAPTEISPPAPIPPPVIPPAPKPPNLGLAAFPAVGSVDPVSPATVPSLGLPIVSLKSNLTELAAFIGTDGKLPPRGAISLGEMLNNFPLRLNGVAAIAKGTAKAWHPDTRASGITNHAATLTAELIACPWKPSASLLLISIRANAQNDTNIQLTLRANPETVRTYQLLGFPSSTGENIAAFPDKLPKGAVSNIAVEIEPSTPGGNLASLEWSADGTAAPPITLVRQPAAEPSNDARFAALVCTYALWLNGQRTGIIDADIVSALAREISSSSLTPEQTTLLNLVDKSLHLAAP